MNRGKKQNKTKQYKNGTTTKRGTIQNINMKKIRITIKFKKKKKQSKKRNLSEI